MILFWANSADPDQEQSNQGGHYLLLHLHNFEVSHLI